MLSLVVFLVIVSLVMTGIAAFYYGCDEGHGSAQVEIRQAQRQAQMQMEAATRAAIQAAAQAARDQR